MSDAGHNQVVIAAELKIATARTIHNVLKRYMTTRLDGALYDRPRKGQPRKMSKRQFEKIVAIACSKPPEGFSRWSLDLLKEKVEITGIVKSISKENLRIVLHEHEIKPWKRKMWCVPNLNEQYISRMNDILDLYEKPINPDEPVVCLDEKPVQLLDSKYPEQSTIQGVRQDYEYIRKGTANIFCAVEPNAGKHMTYVKKRKTAKDFAMVVKSVAEKYLNAQVIHLVMDNLNTHKEKSLIETFGQEQGKKIWSRFQVHYTPKHASWLNQAEIEISMCSRQCLGKRRIETIQKLRKEIYLWNKRMNRKKVTIDWTFTKKKAKKKFKLKTRKN